jgi:hypothetical protein
MRLQAKTGEKLADRFRPNPSLEAETKEGGHDQAQEPSAAFFRFPQPRLGMTVSAFHRLEVTMHAAFRKTSALGKASNALLTVCPNRVDNLKTFGPKSHVGRSSDGWLKS